jgi:4-diphosphocytidyl-2-C-methyl-D-erythritol kinase
MKFICQIKVNLNLHILSKRPDFLHNLQSLVVFVKGGDVVFFEPAEREGQGGAPSPLAGEGWGGGLVVTGPFADAVPTDETNSIVRAHRAFEQAAGYPIPGRWHLEKTVPVGAGLGSASANAAGALRLLQKIHFLSEEKLLDIGKSIGSDVSVCLLNENALMEGTGDRLTPAPDVATLPMVIVFPGVMLSTKMMFNHFYDFQSNYCDEISIQNMKDILATHNAFEPLACQQAPVVAEVLSALRATPGCTLARLSGSGSACFGLYETQQATEAAAQDIKKRFPDMWVRGYP